MSARLSDAQSVTVRVGRARHTTSSGGDRVILLAELIRDEAERYAEELKVCPDLCGWCGIVSAAFVAVCRQAWIEAEVANGCLDGHEGHFWAMVAAPFVVVPTQWCDYATIWDLTASQFERFAATRIVRLGPGDPARCLYELEELGDQLLEDQPVRDKLLTAVLTSRALVVAEARGLL